MLQGLRGRMEGKGERRVDAGRVRITMGNAKRGGEGRGGGEKGIP